MKVLLVDDEKYTREGIIENLNWRELGVSVCAVCEDGKSAYEKAQSFKPDILITDVRMPIMDGISLARKIHEDFPYCKIIFMSGFSDKEYLFAAMRLKAVEYVEKPVIKEIPVVKKVFRTKYKRSITEYCILGSLCFLLGLVIGSLL